MSKYYKYINTLFVVTPMTFFMAFIAILKNTGFVEGWHKIFLTSWLTMLPIAYILAFIILPIAGKITNGITNKKEKQL